MFAGGVGYKSVARRLGVPVPAAKQWSLSYRSGGQEALMTGQGRRTYDYETKLAAVRDHVEHGLTKAETMARHGIAAVTSLERWCRQYRAGGPEALRPAPKGRPRGSGAGPGQAPGRERSLEEEVAFLRAKVAYLEKARALLASRSPTGTRR